MKTTLRLLAPALAAAALMLAACDEQQPAQSSKSEPAPAAETEAATSPAAGGEDQTGMAAGGAESTMPADQADENPPMDETDLPRDSGSADR